MRQSGFLMAMLGALAFIGAALDGAAAQPPCAPELSP